MNNQEKQWIREAGKIAEATFAKEKQKMGVDAKMDLQVTRSVWGPPMVGKNVYGEAFPFEKPPRIKVEVFAPEATEKQIRSTIRHELVHVKYPKRAEPYDYPGKPRTRSKTRGLAGKLLKGY